MNIVGRSRAGGFRLARAIAPRRPAIIHARNFGCWAESLAAGLMLRRCSVLLGFHGLERDGVFNTKQRRLARWAFRLGARFTSVSYAGRDKLTREAGIPPRRIDVLTNGVDLDRFARDDGSRRDIVRQCFGYSPQDIVLGSVASLTPVKDHQALIRAVRHLRGTNPQVKLLLVGDGPQRAELEQSVRISRLAGSITFTGWRDDVPDLLSAMDIYVCSSRSEGMSNSVLESMASGLAVVATSVGDNEAIIADGREGRLVSPNDVAALARVLQELVYSPEARHAYGCAARLRARHFSFDAARRRYELYYKSLRSGQSSVISC